MLSLDKKSETWPEKVNGDSFLKRFALYDASPPASAAKNQPKTAKTAKNITNHFLFVCYSKKFNKVKIKLFVTMTSFELF